MLTSWTEPVREYTATRPAKGAGGTTNRTEALQAKDNGRQMRARRRQTLRRACPMCETARVDGAEIDHQHRCDRHERSGEVVLGRGLRSQPDRRLTGHGRINAVATGLTQGEPSVVLVASVPTIIAPALRRRDSRATTSAAGGGGPLDALSPISVSAQHPRTQQSSRKDLGYQDKYRDVGAGDPHRRKSRLRMFNGWLPRTPRDAGSRWSASDGKRSLSTTGSNGFSPGKLTICVKVAG